jgi:hypothetical protein
MYSPANSFRHYGTKARAKAPPSVQSNQYSEQAMQRLCCLRYLSRKMISIIYGWNSTVDVAACVEHHHHLALLSTGWLLLHAVAAAAMSAGKLSLNELFEGSSSSSQPLSFLNLPGCTR